VSGRRNGTVRSEDGIGEFEEGVAPAVEAFVKRAAEGAESIERFHDALIMHSPTASRTYYPSAELKRKLRACLVKVRVRRFSRLTGMQRPYLIALFARCTSKN